MASYLELVRQDACCHGPSDDASAGPLAIQQFVRSLQTELKLPRWIKSDPLPYTNERVLALLNSLRHPDEVTRVHALQWDQNDDDDFRQRFRDTFNAALIDCARIQAVVDAEYMTQTPYPKESFLAVLVRDAILNAHPELFSLEDVAVALPRHFSGERIPILKFMTTNIRAPLIISLCEEISLQEGVPDLAYQFSDGEEDSTHASVSSAKYIPTIYSPPTMSEFLDACERPMTLEEEEDEEEENENPLPPQFEAHFIAPPSSTTPPSTCHIPVFFMAEEEQLPVLMSSLLYQRRVWHIPHPLLGMMFSKYDTIIKLYIGWLEDDMPDGRVLPRVHLAEIGTPTTLDLSSPSVTLAIVRLLCRLGPHLSGVRDTVKGSVGAVVSEIEPHSPHSWRIDTELQKEDSASVAEMSSTLDLIIRWTEAQQYLGRDETMPRRRPVDETSLPGSAPSVLASERSTSTRSLRTNVTSHSLNPSTAKTSPIAATRELDGRTESIPTSLTRYSCSRFAATSEKDDHRIFHWMFDRRVVPQSIPSDLEFREEYARMTRFIWPDTWLNRDDLPSVDVALEPCVKELLEGVAALRLQGNGIQFVPVEDFPFDFRLLEQSFSAVFQASRRCREKKQLRQSVSETDWRHDHDRLLFDFFVRLIQRSRGSPPPAQTDGQSIAHLEDPLARPTLETTLRFPKSDNLNLNTRSSLQRSIRRLVLREPVDIDRWASWHGSCEDQLFKEEQYSAYVISQWLTWISWTNAEAKSQMITRLGMLPATGRCDALGRLLVELPNVSSEQLGDFPLVSRAAGIQDTGGGKLKASSSTTGRGTGNEEKSKNRSSTKKSDSALAVPDTPAGSAAGSNGLRYSMPSSSIPSSMPSLGESQQTLGKSIDSLACRTQRLQLDPDPACLELPILTVEYKKTSDNAIKGTNQLRMYLTACVKFLQAVGITNMPVYGVQADGPIAVLPAAILRDDNFVYMFERLVERMDISTPVGAWHYATILCRLAQAHAKVLEEKFERVKSDLITSLTAEGGNRGEGWTIDEQVAKLKAENMATSPPPGTSGKQAPEAN